MAPATMNLPETSINCLQDLIQENLDSRDVFLEAAGNLKTENSAVESLFRELSRERARQAGELQAIVASNAKEPEKSGSVRAAAHRAWMNLRSTLGGGEYAMLSEAERGEDHIKGEYEAALKDLGSCSCTTILRRQYAAVEASHNRVRKLRDRRKHG